MDMPMPMPPPPVWYMPPMGPPPAPGMPGMFMPMPEMHAAFFWGQVLFHDWPGDRSNVGMYILCLLVMFVLTTLIEALSAASKGVSSRRLAAVLVITGIHAVKVGLAYVVMLAVMSFNVGVLLAAVVGHAIGYLLTRIGLFRRATNAGEDGVPRNGALVAPKAESRP